MTDPIQLEHRVTVDGNEYDLLEAEARTALDELGLVRCEIQDGTGGPAPSALVGKPLVLGVQRKDDASQELHFAGVVVEATRSTLRGVEGEKGTTVIARPRLYRLTLRADCRVFQDMAAPDIVKAVLAGAGVTDHVWKITRSYPPRVYTTQYRETDFAFVQRLLAEEGIAFAIDSSSGKDVVVFFDKDLGDVAGDKTIVHRPSDGLMAASDAIFGVTHEKVTAPGKVNLRDYDFEHPRLSLDSKAQGDDAGEASLEVYHYPGRFTEPSRGDALAQVLLDSLRARREVVSGPTSSLRLAPGHLFTLDEHPYAPLNQEYLVLEASLLLEARREGNRHEQRIAFRAIPTAKTPYRPARVPPAQAVPGAQLAVITGPAGAEIHPDSFGRVKVQFPWDRLGKKDDTSSLWIRTAQLPLGGSMLTPRVGWEAYLNFTDGDPDMPFVFGRMYNAEKPPPYELPKHKTRMSIQTATTPGGGSTNEIRMDDKAGHEEMFMNASKDASVSAGNNATEAVGNNESRTIGANQKLAVTGAMSAHIGANQVASVSGNQNVHVGTKMVDDVGSHSLGIGGNRDLKAGGDHKRTVTGASSLTIGGMQVDLVAGSVDENGLATMSDSVGAALIELTASNRTVTVAQSRSEKAGGAKIILAGGGRSVKVGTGLNQKVGAAVLTGIKGPREDASEGDYLEVAGGAQIISAVNVVFEAQSLLSVVMGASTITLTKGSVSIAGTSITLNGDVADEGILVVDNC